jgi:hypothetical protein
MKPRYLFIALLLLFSTGSVWTQPAQGVVYVSLFMHNEDSALGDLSQPDTRTVYLNKRQGLVDFARMLKRNGVAFCWQSDWKFLEGVLLYETPELMAVTNNKNLVRWLSEDMGLSVDAHSHENYGYNYADVAYLIDSLGVTPNQVIGGHIYDPFSDKFQDWERFRMPLAGEHYPQALWTGSILMGSGTPNHTYDPEPSGLWRPKGKYEYWTDDPAGNIVCVGQYSGDVAGVERLVQLYQNGTVAPAQILTASLYVGQSFPPGMVAAYEDSVVKPLLALQEAGSIRIVTFTELVEIWQTRYHGVAHLYNAPVTLQDTVRTWIPSSAGGSAGIAAEIVFPETPRYAEGAPIVVHVPGGWNGAGMDSQESIWPEQGFIQISFNFPGSGRPGAISGGLYDDRGEQCLTALRDVTRFALGLIPDGAGHDLADYAGAIEPLYGNVGLCGLSNGGNATISTAGAFGSELPGLAWIVNWESPVGDGMPNTEAGAGEGGLNPLVNPAYNPNTGAWRLDLLAWDGTLVVRDNDNPAISFNGGFYFDINGNHAVDPGTDYLLSPYLYQNKAYYSVRVRRAAQDRALVPAIPPAHLASPAETEAFWLYRNGEYWIAEAVKHNPALLFLVVAGEEDHVQNAPDHPHVLIQYEGFRTANARFVRLNPDRSFVEEVAARSIPGAMDNDGFAPFDHLTIRTAVEPGGPAGVNSTIGVAAAICELADRTQYTNLQPQYEGGSTLVAQDAPPGAFELLQAWPNPFNPATTVCFSLAKAGHVDLRVFDLRGRQVAVLLDGELTAGRHECRFTAVEQQGTALASGCYLLRLQSEAGIQTGKILLMK